MAVVDELLELDDTSPRVVDFARMPSKPKPPSGPSTPETNVSPTGQPLFWDKWGPTIIVGILSPALLLLGEFYFRSSTKADVASDDHVKQLVGPIVDPAKNGIDARFDKIDANLVDLAGKVGHVQGEIDELNSRATKITAEQDGLKKRVDSQESLYKLQDPGRIFATIRAEIQLAQAGNSTLPATQLADYRNALRALPSSTTNYWVTVAAVINYQSLLNQLSGNAPDPAKVAKQCAFVGPNSDHNTYLKSTFRDCFVYLDTENFQNVTFQDSVIHYRGGPVGLANVKFINCTFMLELTARPTNPAQEKVLRALLDSPDQKSVNIVN